MKCCASMLPLWLQVVGAATTLPSRPVSSTLELLPSEQDQSQCAGFDVTTGVSCRNATQLPDNPHVPAATVQECCTACTKLNGCETFVWQDPEDAEPQRNCRLAGHCPGESLKKESKTTGVKHSSPAPAPTPAPGACNITIHHGASCPNATFLPTGRIVLPAASVADCCAACEAHGPECGTFIFTDPEQLGSGLGTCLLKGRCPELKPTAKTTGTRPVPPPGPPPPPLPPPPLPPPVPPGTQKNIVVLLTDDQDLRLGSMRAMPYTMQYIGNEGVNISNFFVHTPICCPSRTTLLSGRFYHNNKVSQEAAYDREAPYRGCMSMNTSRVYNPSFWDDSLVANLKRRGYATAVFGKMLNVMDTFGCAEGFIPPYLDRFLIMCNHNFFSERWADSSDPNRSDNASVAINQTGTAPSDYTTSQIGNASLAWIRSVIERGGESHPPFFAWLGPHAPHKPSTPPQWYENHPIGHLPLIKGPSWDYFGSDKHIPLSLEPPITPEDEAAIIQEQAYRLRSLLAVDDVVKGLREYLLEVDEWDRTYWVFTSDHGYNLGQFRVDSDKTMVYDHVTRVPFLIKGPGISAAQVLTHVASMADVAPTLLELIAGTSDSAQVRAEMDGTSWAPLLLAKNGSMNGGTVTPTSKFARTATLIELQSSGKMNRCSNMNLASPPGTPPAIVYNYSCHYHDGPNNTFAAMRIIAPETGDLLYAEFVDGSDPAGYYFAPSAINFYELYNVTEDYYQMRNIYSEAPLTLKELLHDRLQQAVGCKGSKQCEAFLEMP